MKNVGAAVGNEGLEWALPWLSSPLQVGNSQGKLELFNLIFGKLSWKKDEGGVGGRILVYFIGNNKEEEDKVDFRAATQGQIPFKR